MKFEVIALRRADEDIRLIARWLAQHSPSGAISWLDAYEQMLVRLATSADACSAAAEDAQFNLPLQQALFGTPRGQTYRAVFTIVGDQVRILRVRGPGQPPLQQDELI